MITLPYNLIVYTDQKLYPKLWKIRKRYNLLEKTYFYVLNKVEDLPFFIYYHKIVENRSSSPVYEHSRNTPLYFIMAASKSSFMIQKSIQLNPFNSTHFAWIDYGYEHAATITSTLMDQALQTALSKKFNKPRFCYIHYRLKEITSNVEKMYGTEKNPGLCGVSSNFYTGEKKCLYEFACNVGREFLHTILSGYGHSDEQLITTIVNRNPEKYDITFGDYPYTLMNYIQIEYYVAPIIHLFLLNCKDDVTLRLYACLALMDAVFVRKIKHQLNNVAQLQLLYFTYLSFVHFLEHHKDDKNLYKANILQGIKNRFEEEIDLISSEEKKGKEMQHLIKFFSSNVY